MNTRKIVREKLVSEVAGYSKAVPFFRICTTCEHKVILNDDITPMADPISGDFAPVPGFGAIYRLIGDGSHTPTFTGFKKISASEDYDSTLDVLNLVTFMYDGSDYWYSITKEA